MTPQKVLKSRGVSHFGVDILTLQSYSVGVGPWRSTPCPAESVRIKRPAKPKSRIHQCFAFWHGGPSFAGLICWGSIFCRVRMFRILWGSMFCRVDFYGGPFLAGFFFIEQKAWGSIICRAFFWWGSIVCRARKCCIRCQKLNFCELFIFRFFRKKTLFFQINS